MLDPLDDVHDFPPSVRAILRLCAATIEQVKAGKLDGVVMLEFKSGQITQVLQAGDVPPYVAAEGCRRLANRLDWS